MFGLLSADCLQTNKALKAAALSPTPVAGNDVVTASVVLTVGRPHPIEEEIVRECVYVCVDFLWYV